MVSFGGILQSLVSNWVTIVVTALATGVTVYLTRRYQTNARKERLDQAKESVVSVVEEHVIDDKDLNIDKLDDLISAAERRHNVPLSDHVTKVSLLEDLELKIESSSHLNSEQKQEYTNQIQGYISEIETKENTPIVNRELQEIFESLSENIESGQKEAAKNDVEDLKDKASKLAERPHDSYRRAKFRTAQMILTIIVIFSIWYYVLNGLFIVLNINIESGGIIVLLLVLLLPVILSKIE